MKDRPVTDRPVGVGFGTARSRMQLIESLEEAVNEIALFRSQEWPGWIVFILEALQNEPSGGNYEEFLRCVKGAIDARLEDGEW